MTRFVIFLLLLLSCQVLGQEALDVQQLGVLLESRLESLEGENGMWKGTLRERPIFVMADQSHNRMRILTPIREVSDPLDSSDLKKCMEANFTTALDARYAIFEDVLWSVYLHPLSTLTEEQLESALRQVVNLANSHGEDYSSGELEFAPGQESEPEPLQDEVGYSFSCPSALIICSRP